MNNDTPIVNADAASLTAGSLARLFAAGAIAVVIDCAPQLHRIWDGLLENETEQLPWQGTMSDMARNHYAGRDLGGHVGDMFHYTPYRIAYIARKFELSKDPDAAQPASIPPCFHQSNGAFTSPVDIVQACWTLTEQIMSWLTPPSQIKADYQAVVHRLKYERDFELIERYYALTKSAVGRWAQLGHKIDTLREEAHGVLGHNGISDLFAIFSLAPPLRRMLANLNHSLSSGNARDTLPENAQLIGKPHYDGRYFSAMCGARGNICTEAYDGKNWHELPIDRDHLVIIPGLDAKRAFHIQPTLHRILHRPTNTADAVDGSEPPNLTLLFGAK